MTDRERLVELIGSKVCEEYSPSCDEYEPHTCEKCYANFCKVGDLADAILADGWMRPPCKVGDTVYYFSHRPLNLSVQANTVYEAIVVRIVTTRLGTQLVIQIRNEHGCTEVPDIRSWGKTVFGSREEAEAKLKEGGKG